MVKVGRGDILSAMPKKMVNISMYVLITDVHYGVAAMNVVKPVGNIAN